MWMKLQFPCLAAVKKEFSSHFHCFLTFLFAFYDRIIKWFFSFPLLLCSQLKSAAESRLSQVKRFCNLQLESQQSDADKEHELRVRWHEWALRNIENREIKKKFQIRLHRKLNCIPQCSFSSTSNQSFAFAIWACATSNERKIKIQHSRNHIAATERERASRDFQSGFLAYSQCSVPWYHAGWVSSKTMNLGFQQLAMSVQTVGNFENLHIVSCKSTRNSFKFSKVISLLPQEWWWQWRRKTEAFLENVRMFLSKCSHLRSWMNSILWYFCLLFRVFNNLTFNYEFT